MRLFEHVGSLHKKAVHVVVHASVVTTHHVIDCIDGKKEPPLWLHRSHRVLHLVYLVSAVFVIFHIIHEGVVVALTCVEASTFFMGVSSKEFREIDPD